MKAIIQKVNNASVKVKEELISEIGRGLVVFLGVEKGDSLKEVEFLVDRAVKVRCFEDEKNKMNLSVKDIAGEILVVPEFTLCADLLRGRRPGFEKAAPFQEAEKLYRDFIVLLVSQGVKIKQGKFREHMVVDISNDGPVTFILDS
ncbi:MAG: D-aminoacyl-tRNA deacylase [Candidatus Omnitrophota bacterium]|nr:D-aminoacyl-tRNA deacylase [Candidatus Omnitrophota bacterium]